MSETQRKAFSVRALTTMLTTGGFLVMSVTGLALFTIPSGRVANWVDWSMAGLTKDEWSAIHITSSLLFIGAGVVHLWFNWRQFTAFVRERLHTRIRLRPEMPIAAVLLLALSIGTIKGIAPFTWVIDLSTGIKDSWSVDPAMEPPFGHAEEVTLKTLGLRTAISPDALLAAIKDAGWTVTGTQQTVRQIADANKSSPAQMWLEVQKRVPAAKPEAAGANAPSAWTPDAVEARFAGSGIGNKTVEQAAIEAALSTDDFLGRLKAAGVQAKRTDRMKTLAETAGTTSTELLKSVLVPDYHPASP